MIRAVANVFRAARRPVFYTRFIAGPSRTLMWSWSPECGEELRSCWRGQRRRYGDRSEELEGPAIVDEFTPAPGDEVIDKYGYGGFHNTSLENAPRARGVNQVVVTGAVTQICVEETVREGFHRGLEMVVLRDAVASFDQDLHDATFRNLAMKFPRVLRAADVLAAFEPGLLRHTDVVRTASAEGEGRSHGVIERVDAVRRIE